MAQNSGNAIDDGQVNSYAALALGEPLTGLVTWHKKQLSGGFESGNSLYLISGQAPTASGQRDWSMILKTVKRDESTDASPQSLKYWRREADFYNSGLVDDLSCTLITPRCYGVNLQDDRTLIWLETMQDDLPKPWSMAHYSEAARCLGCFNGQYLAGRPLPEAPWLTQDWLRQYVELAAPSIRDLACLRKLRVFQLAYANIDDSTILDAWQRRGEFLDVLDRLPQTFCHQDAFEGNLFWRKDRSGQGQLVGLDWAYTGMAAVGVELAPLVAMAFHIPPDQKRQLYELCLEGYLAGLEEAGYRADRRQVRFASLVAIFYRYFFSLLGEFWPNAWDERSYPMLAGLFGLPSIDHVMGLLYTTNPFQQDNYAEICQLVEQV